MLSKWSGGITTRPWWRLRARRGMRGLPSRRDGIAVGVEAQHGRHPEQADGHDDVVRRGGRERCRRIRARVVDDHGRRRPGRRRAASPYTPRARSCRRADMQRSGGRDHVRHDLYSRPQPRRWGSTKSPRFLTPGRRAPAERYRVIRHAERDGRHLAIFNPLEPQVADRRLESQSPLGYWIFSGENTSWTDFLEAVGRCQISPR